MRMAMLILFLFTLPLFSHAHAAKKLVRKPEASAAKSVSYSSVKLNRASHSAVVTFTNLKNVKNAEYTLSYTANGIPQGAVGSFNPTGTSEQRDLYFGTCSKGVCTPHYGITNATLTIRIKFTSGASYTKRYRFARI